MCTIKNGACVALADINEAETKKQAELLQKEYGADRAMAITMNVTDLESITAAIGEVDGVAVFLVDGVAHLVTADAELLGVGEFHAPVEPTPEEHAASEARDQQATQRPADRWRAQRRICPSDPTGFVIGH